MMQPKALLKLQQQPLNNPAIAIKNARLKIKCAFFIYTNHHERH